MQDAIINYYYYYLLLLLLLLLLLFKKEIKAEPILFRKVVDCVLYIHCFIAITSRSKLLIALKKKTHTHTHLTVSHF
jgi:hypothetical protein